MAAPYALIGAHAMAARGYPRFRVGVDLLTTDPRVLDRETWTDLEDDGTDGVRIAVPLTSDLILSKRIDEVRPDVRVSGASCSRAASDPPSPRLRRGRPQH
jgi:hypothetical protein